MAPQLTTACANPATKGFFLQFVSLMLIILTIISGTLTRPRVPTNQADAESGKKFEVLDRASKWNVLPGGMLDFTPEVVQARQEVLRAHDVVLEIEITSPSLSEGLMQEREIRLLLDPESERTEFLRVSIVVDDEDVGRELRERWYMLEKGRLA